MKRLALVLALLGFAVLAPQAHAYLYWASANGLTGSIGRANLDSTGANPALIDSVPSPSGVAANGSYAFWGESGGPGATLGRANLDGTEPNRALATLSTNGIAVAMAANQTHVFAAVGQDGHGYIVRVAVDGSDVRPAFVDTGDNPSCGVTVDGGFVYWLDDNWVGRANLDGSGAVPHWADTGMARPCGLALDGTYLYFGEYVGPNAVPGTRIGRVDRSVDPPIVAPNFIDGANQVFGVAVNAGFLYWTNRGTNSIGRANADGTGVQQQFLANVSTPLGLAIDIAGGPPAPPSVGRPPMPPLPKLPPSFQGDVESSNARFVVGRASTPTRGRSAAKKWVPRGTVFAYSLDKDATVKIAFKRAVAGRKVGGKCKASKRKPAKRKLAKRKRCQRFVKAGTPLIRESHAGVNTVLFSGRIKRKALEPGRYQATFTASADGKTSLPVALRFRIVKP
jgi:hypothetical protein